MTQTSLDLRAAIAARRSQAPISTAKSRSLAEATNVFTGNAPAPERRSSVRPFQPTARQIDMIRDMMAERYVPETATELFEAIDWTKIDTRDKFQAIFKGLKDTPRLSKKAPEKTEAPAPAEVAEPVSTLMEGIFTVEFEDGTYRTIRVRRQAKDASFRPGQILLAYLSGPDNSNSYTGFGEANEVGQVKIWFKHRDKKDLAQAVKVLLGDQAACAKAYARRSQKCSFCNLELTHPESLNAGWGKRCAEKHGLPWG